MIKSRKENTTNAGHLVENNFENYYKYQHFIPKSIIGSKNYWKSKYNDLTAMVQRIGLPSLFVTLTQNDSWPELQQLLQKYPKDRRATIFNPVDVAEYFFKRFNLVLNEIKRKNGIFGEVINYWYRVEFQNRGAIHIHMLLWIKNDPVENSIVCAQIPNYNNNDVESTMIKEYVEKYQIHTCRANRCFMNNYCNKPLLRCKYGFPFKEQIKDELIGCASGYLYKRTTTDANVVPYYDF